MTVPSLTALLDLLSGELRDAAATYTRRLSDMRGYYRDPEAEARLLADDPLIYTYGESFATEVEGQLRFGSTIIQPGRVGDEYFMTRGHYHARPEAGEVYLALRGHGMLVLDRRDGRGEALELRPGTVAYTPPGCAHRAVNVGDEPFSFFSVWPANAGHDYASIQRDGFSLRVVERNGRPTVIPARSAP